MKRLPFLFFAFLVGLGFGHAPAYAGKSDDAWAKCLWETVPSSTNNWLAMPLPKRDYGLAQPPAEYVLQYRLQGACHEKLIPTGKKSPPSFNAKSIRLALEKMKPLGVRSDLIDPKAFRCTRYFLNDTEFKNPAAYSWGFGEGSNEHIVSSITYFFAAQGGGSVGLPNSGGLKKCQWIKEDGTFIDA